MSYIPFYKLFPELAMQETRSISILSDNDPLPHGNYGLMEMYCDEKNCDCRRVIFMIISPQIKQPVAYIGYGWENKDFYARLIKYDRYGNKGVSYANLDDKEKRDVDELKGPCLNSMSPQSKYAKDILKLIAGTVLNDEMYDKRLKGHYKLFKRKLKKAKYESLL